MTPQSQPSADLMMNKVAEVIEAPEAAPCGRRSLPSLAVHVFSSPCVPARTSWWGRQTLRESQRPGSMEHQCIYQGPSGCRVALLLTRLRLGLACMLTSGALPGQASRVGQLCHNRLLHPVLQAYILTICPGRRISRAAAAPSACIPPV